MKRSLQGQLVVVLVLVSLVTGCVAPEPMLRSNKKLQLYGRDLAQQEIKACREEVEQAGLAPGIHQSGNAATGAFLGGLLGSAVGASAGIVGGLPGVTIGAAAGGGLGLIIGLFGGTFKPLVPDPPYVDAFEQCMKEKGYEVTGWE